LKKDDLFIREIINSMELVEIFEGNLIECHLIKNLLENEGIDTYLQNEYMGAKSGIMINSMVCGVKVFVSLKDYDFARKVVRKFIDNGKSL